MARQDVSLGQAYQPPTGTYFASPALLWIVKELFIAVDGLPHVKLLCSVDRTLSKTVSAAALGDSRLFRLVSG